ncbi:hypothetical protein KCG53_04405 [Neisseria subflava]|uniref:Uncharacterized protein n=1 Tax=Neisseria subflava TaxID=28449 RepID=A0A9X9I6R6_NEISU|nr:hypothetical protein KCG53_04405 [Neisseria subflava]
MSDSRLCGLLSCQPAVSSAAKAGTAVKTAADKRRAVKAFMVVSLRLPIEMGFIVKRFGGYAYRFISRYQVKSLSKNQLQTIITAIIE